MNFEQYLKERKISKYQLSKLSGVPKTTILDICSGRSSIERCSAKTVALLAKALGCSMEEIMAFFSPYDAITGLPKDNSYLECGLPPFLQESLDKMKETWKKLDHDEVYLHWDIDYCDLQSDINSAEVNLLISSEQAWYLREKYLRMERG